jgi:hypothetical protein
MNQSLSLYYLYCINRHCQVSIYHRPEELQIPFTVENITKDHICTRCNHLLSSAIDLNIKKMMTEVNHPINSNMNLSHP